MTQTDRAAVEGAATALGARGAVGTEPRYELLAPAALDNPYPTYDEMRTKDPVYRDRRFLGWILTRYDDVAAVLREPRVSSLRPLPSEPVGRSLASIEVEVR